MTSNPPRNEASGMVLARYIVLCQAGWFACVLGGAHERGEAGILVALIAVAFHLARARDAQREARFIVAAVAIGWTWESLIAHAGLLLYPHSTGFAPAWMAALWALFAIQFNVLFRWLRARPAWAAALGAIAGPLSFRAGSALGAVRFPDTAHAMIALAAGWTILMPLMVRLAAQWDGMALPPSRE
ncbi:MAG TPA: DUF2878 domain-containing protein [Moraxellaceae bacterium]|nr:DUF2878 domain-containing protein [Moraxellaceae bacterium]